MDHTNLWITLITLVFAAGGLLAVFWFFRPAFGRRRGSGPVIELPCSECDKTLIFHVSEMAPLSPAERALVTRSWPQYTRHPLAEYTCPYCEASHCFDMQTKPLKWLGANVYTPQQTQKSRCAECHKRLGRPPWPEGAMDGKLAEAPELSGDLGLRCKFCGSVCCVSCCKANSRGKTKDDFLVCPRCFRHPNDIFVHP